MNYIFIKQKDSNGKSDTNYTALKSAVQNLVNAASTDLPFSAVIAQLQASPPSGWTAPDITEGLIKQVAQDLHLPHA